MNYAAVRRLLFLLEPETAHRVTLNSLSIIDKLGLGGVLFKDIPSNPVLIMGLEFPNQIGLAAGMDKNAQCIDGLGLLRFGFIEVGTVTPRAQSGGSFSSLFRIPSHSAIINRMSFNNLGLDYVVSKLAQQRSYKGILGVNIGKNYNTLQSNAVNDYLVCQTKVFEYADYIAVNLSSPNTPGLRDLQKGEYFEEILDKLTENKILLSAKYNKTVPLVIKIAPDMYKEELALVCEKLLKYEIDGVIATNTTITREGLSNVKYVGEKGGLSGLPLFHLSTETIKRISTYTNNKIPIIASGGIMSPEHAIEKIVAGASLVQLYTGLVYEGPSLVVSTHEKIHEFMLTKCSS